MYSKASGKSRTKDGVMCWLIAWGDTLQWQRTHAPSKPPKYSQKQKGDNKIQETKEEDTRKMSKKDIAKISKMK